MKYRLNHLYLTIGSIFIEIGISRPKPVRLNLIFIHLHFLNLPSTIARPVHRFVFLNAITVSRTSKFTACFYYWEIDFAHSSVKIYRVLNLSITLDFDKPIYFHLDNIARTYRPLGSSHYIA